MDAFDEKEQSKKDLILDTTIEIIKKEGFDGITIRKIAKLANVNIGLINYYYGSKDKLINAVIQKLIASLKASFQVFDDEHLSPKERLKQFLMSYSAVTEKYPFIIQVMINQEPILFDSYSEYVNFVRAVGLQKVRETIAQLSGETDHEKLNIMLTQVLAGSITPVLIEPLYEKVTGSNFPDIEKRIDILLERYFSNPIK